MDFLQKQGIQVKVIPGIQLTINLKVFSMISYPYIN